MKAILILTFTFSFSLPSVAAESCHKEIKDLKETLKKHAGAENELNHYVEENDKKKEALKKMGCFDLFRMRSNINSKPKGSLAYCNELKSDIVSETRYIKSISYWVIEPFIEIYGQEEYDQLAARAKTPDEKIKLYDLIERTLDGKSSIFEDYTSMKSMTKVYQKNCANHSETELQAQSALNKTRKACIRHLRRFHANIKGINRMNSQVDVVKKSRLALKQCLAKAMDRLTVETVGEAEPEPALQ